MTSTKSKTLRLIALTLLIGCSTAYAQNNLVENPGFDETEKNEIEKREPLKILENIQTNVLEISARFFLDCFIILVLEKSVK